MLNPWVLHIDGDGFFAYCEISRFPHLKGKAVVVGEDRGIACAMTYEAKKLGIVRGMPIFKIRQQFPEVVILSSHFELYEHYARKLATLVQREVDVLERYSIDECFALIQLPAHWSEEELEKWLKALKNSVQSQLGITYSFGMARTKVLAKIASKKDKPDGCTVITAAKEASVLEETSIESVWGIGWKLSRRFQNMKVKTASQFASWKEARVRETFSLPVQELWHELHGRMMFAVSDECAIPKSLQATKSFTPSSDVYSFVLAELLQNIDIAFSRMRKQGLTTKHISIFLKTAERTYFSMNISLPHYTSNPLDVSTDITQCMQSLFKKGVKYKSTGITLWALRRESDVAGDLFGAQQEVLEERSIMDAVDVIRKRYGSTSIMLLAGMPSTNDRNSKSRARMEKEQFVHGLPLPYLGEVY